MKWQPIETAPEDGTWVHVYWPTMPITRYPQVAFNHGDEYGWDTPDDYGHVQPTHWMPLPSPPCASDSAGSEPQEDLSRAMLVPSEIIHAASALWDAVDEASIAHRVAEEHDRLGKAFGMLEDMKPVPDDMVMVPREPTEAMIKALDAELHEHWPDARSMAINAYRAMLSAAPTEGGSS